MIDRFLDPKNDVVFKKIFGTEKNKDILIHFLNDMITFKEEGGLIAEVAFLKTSQDPEIAAKKTSIVDILCSDEKGNQYIVEMQVAKERGFEKPARYYVGGKYHDLKEVIFLAIIDFIMFPEEKAYKSDHVILDQKTHKQHLKDFSFTFLELPKFKVPSDKLCTITDKWMYFFKHGQKTLEENLEKIIGPDAIIERAYNELSIVSWNEEDYRAYEQSKKYERDQIAIWDQKLIEGEIKRANEIARNLLQEGVDIQIISKATRLSIDAIKSLQDS